MEIFSAKIAVPSSPPGGLNSNLNVRFGRCDFFTIIQIENKEIKEVIILPNPAKDAAGGAGPMAVQTLVDQKVQVLVGGDYGPNAKNAFLDSGIKVYGHPSNAQNLSVKLVVELFLKGEIPAYI